MILTVISIPPHKAHLVSKNRCFFLFLVPAGNVVNDISLAILSRMTMDVPLQLIRRGVKIEKILPVSFIAGFRVDLSKMQC